MDVATIATVIGGPFGLSAIALWFAFKKDQQCIVLMEKITQLAVNQATVNERSISSIDALRDAIRQGTRP
jgi:hypothetical protein